MEYAPAFKINSEGSSPAIAMVKKSRNEKFKEGEYVYSFEYPWVQKRIWNDDSVNSMLKLEKLNTYGIEPSYFLGTLGLTGVTAYLGLKYESNIPNQPGKTLVISGAAGAVGSAGD